MRLFLSIHDVFKYSKAVAATVNSLYNDIRDWTVSTLNTDQLKPRSLDTMHLGNHISTIAVKVNNDISAVAPASPTCIVSYDAQSTGYRLFAIGFTWPHSKGNNSPDPGHTASYDIGYYDASVVQHRQHRPYRLPEQWRYGSNETAFYAQQGGAWDAPWPGQPAPYVRWSGGPHTVTSFILDPAVDAEQHIHYRTDGTFIAMWGSGDSPDFGGRAQLWVFAEDKDLT